MEEIIKLNEKLQNLKIQYDKMVKNGSKLKDKLGVLNEIENISKSLSSLLTSESAAIYNLGADSRVLRGQYEGLCFENDFFFDNLLYGLNKGQEKYAKINLVFDEYGHTGRGGHGEDTYGKLYYNYMVAGTIDLINSIIERNINTKVSFYRTIEGYIKGRTNDIIISSKNDHLPQITGIEQRKIELPFPTECYYYKGEFAPEIDFVIDTIIETAKVYGVDFRAVEYQKQLMKKRTCQPLD